MLWTGYPPGQVACSGWLTSHTGTPTLSGECSQVPVGVRSGPVLWEITVHLSCPYLPNKGSYGTTRLGGVRDHCQRPRTGVPLSLLSSQNLEREYRFDLNPRNEGPPPMTSDPVLSSTKKSGDYHRDTQIHTVLFIFRYNYNGNFTSWVLFYSTNK